MQKNPYPEVPLSLQRLRFSNIARFVGPGVIIASVTIGSGELVWASRSGAIFGYTMLWCFLYAGTFKAIQVYSASRYITVTGEHPMLVWSRPKVFPIIPLLIALPAVALMPVAFSAIPEILGGFIHRQLGAAVEGEKIGSYDYFEFWVNVWGFGVLVLCLVLALFSNYGAVERLSTVVLAIMIVCVVTSVIVFRPNIGAIISGLAIPQIPEFPQWVSDHKEFKGRSPWLEVSLYLSAVGGGAYDYIGYVGMLREKGWGLAGKEPVSKEELTELVESKDTAFAEEVVRRARFWQRAPFLDTTVSFAFVILVTLLFVILGSQVLHPQQVAPVNDNLLEEQGQFLTALHPNLNWVYRLSVFLAFIGTLYGAFEVYQFTFVESARGMFPKATAGYESVMKAGTIAYCFVGGAIMMWLPKELAGSITDRMTFGSIISGAAGCGLWCFAMLWCDSIRMPKQLQMSWTLRVLLVIAGTTMSYLGIQSIYAYFVAQ